MKNQKKNILKAKDEFTTYLVTNNIEDYKLFIDSFKWLVLNCKQENEKHYINQIAVLIDKNKKGS